MGSLTPRLTSGLILLIQHGRRTWRTQLTVVGASTLKLDAGSMLPKELLHMQRGTPLTCRYHLNAATCYFDTHFLGLEGTGAQTRILITAPENITLRQRRQHLRAARMTPVALRVPILNKALSRGENRISYNCWVPGVALNVSAGGLKAMLELPLKHDILPHKEAWLNMRIDGLDLRSRILRWVRVDMSTEKTVQIYAFSDLSHSEMEAIENLNLRWLSGLRV